MSLRPSRRLLPVLVAAAAAVTSTALGVSTAAGAVDDRSVTTFSELATATNSCAGTVADPTTITLAADIVAYSAPLPVRCHLVLNLAGFEVVVRNVTIAASFSLTIEDSAGDGALTADASNGFGVAGIQTTAAALTVKGGTVTANGGTFGAGIGGGYNLTAGVTTIDGGTVVARGGNSASGIGAAQFRNGSTTIIRGGTVTATGGQWGAGIGAGEGGGGGTTTVSGGTVTATGGAHGAGIGGGFHANPGSSGGTTSIVGGTVTAAAGFPDDGASAVGPGSSTTSFGSLSVDGGVLRLPSGYLQVPDSVPGAEVVVGPDGVIDGSAGPRSSYAIVTGNGQIANHGRILMPMLNVVRDGVQVLDRHYDVSFDTQGGSSAPLAVRVFADTFDHGARTFPADPTKAGSFFTGWNTAADGTGAPVTASSVLSGSSAGGTPVGVTAYAQYVLADPARSIVALTDALDDCTGNADAPYVVALSRDLSDPAAELRIGCDAVLDLAGHDLTVRNVSIDERRSLTVEDVGGGDGSLTADASASSDVAGIRTANAALRVAGGTVTATGGVFAAGIGGTSTVPGGTTTIDGGTVVATGTSAAGIGGGWAAGGGTTTINGGTVTATGGDIASGIGGGCYGSGGTTTVNGGDVTATGGPDSAGIGGGYAGEGGTVTIAGGTVTATGTSRGAGIGGGYFGGGAILDISGGTVTAVGGSTGGSAVGPGVDAGIFGSLSVDGGVLRLPSGAVRVPDSPGVEIQVGPEGVIDGSAGPDATYASFSGGGQVDNGGRILLPSADVTDGGVSVLDRHYAVDFDTQGGSAAPAAVTVFADTFAHGDRSFPPDPTKDLAVFLGWNTAADGSGDPVTATSALPGSSADGTAVQVTAYAQWQLAPAITGVAPSSGSTAGGTLVVITGTGFTGASAVDFGNTGPATSYTVDSDTQITATSPAAPAPVVRHVRVTTAAGASPAVAADRFTYGAVPAVSGIAPSSGPQAGGTVVVITGTGFSGATQVRFGLAGNAAFTVDSDTRITAVAPASASSGVRNVTVRGPGGTSALVTADRYKYLAPPPAVTALAPSSGPRAGGTVVVITGTGFGGATNVVFGVGGSAAFTVDSDTQITVTSPASASAVTRHVRVTTPSGTSPSVAADRFTYH